MPRRLPRAGTALRRPPLRRRPRQAPPEKRQHDVLRVALVGHGDRLAVLIRLQHRGVHVALARDGRRVAELRGDALDRPGDIAFRLAARRAGPGLGQRQRAQHRARPRAEVLGRELVAADLAQVGVDVAGVHAAPRALLVNVLEQLLARQILKAADDAGHARIAHVHRVLLAALATELKAQGGPGRLHVAVAQRGEAERLVGARVLLVAHAHARGLEQAHDGGQHLLARQAAAAEVGIYAGANA